MLAEQSSSIVADALKISSPLPEAVTYPRGTMLVLERYVSELLRWNRSMHIVGRADVALNLTKQLADSIGLLHFAETCGRGMDSAERAKQEGAVQGSWRSVADIGSGAGFPGFVWKILRPSLEITLFERRERMATLLENMSSKLGIEGLAIVRADASEHEPGHTFDLVVSKAAGSFGKIIPVAEKLLRSGGFYCTVKGNEGWREELEERGAEMLELERHVQSRSGGGRLFWFSRRSGTDTGP